jgi:hypothetical protein
MPARYIQLARQCLTQAEQFYNSSRTTAPQVAQRQQVMSAQALKKVLHHVQAALQRMGMQNVPDDDGSFG